MASAEEKRTQIHTTVDYYTTTFYLEHLSISNRKLGPLNINLAP